MALPGRVRSAVLLRRAERVQIHVLPVVEDITCQARPAEDIVEVEVIAVVGPVCFVAIVVVLLVEE